MNDSNVFIDLEKFIENFIIWLFRERCVICGERYRVIHEINPRSSGEGSMDWKNRITLCDKCHHTVHHLGTGEQQIENLKQQRIEFLEQIGRSEYV